MEYPWTLQTMQMINTLTPNVKGKSFDPDWFLLRQRFEQVEEKLYSLGQEWDGEKFTFNREPHEGRHRSGA